MTKKALIVSPYLDHLGGGERYMLSAASALELLGYDIYFSWDSVEQITNLSTMLGIELNKINLDPRIKQLYFAGNPLSMYLATRSYDVVFYLSDGSLPMLGGRKNIIHLQVPFHGVGGRSLKNKIKKTFISDIVVNSRFTKNVVDREYGINSVVLYPPVTPVTVTNHKESIILSVGRFEPSLNAKHQDVLIEAFKQLSPELTGWKLVLAGGSSSDEWVDKLKTMASGLPIEFAVNVSYEELCRLYGSSTIYWHAAGYGLDETKNPELTEHFGISTVEAISAGCIPLVVPYGGQREIVTQTELQWETIPELIEKTKQQIISASKYSFDISPYLVDSFKGNLSKII
jgi:glycosyltransferase involved in cell wall biosynthesis